MWNSPEMALTPQTHYGECWCMDGDQGSLGIALSEPIVVKTITIEYPYVTFGQAQYAPKEMDLYGIENYPKDLNSLCCLSR